MAVEFIRNPNNVGLNETTEPNSTIFQHTLCIIGFECYLTIDVHRDGSGTTEYYTRNQSRNDGEDIEWYEGEYNEEDKGC